MSVELGPGLIGSIYDGIQRPLDAIMRISGNNLKRGVEVPSLKRDAKWNFLPAVHVGDAVVGGDVLGTVQETEIVVHKILVPAGVRGTVRSISAGEYTVTDTVAVIDTPNGSSVNVTLMQKWPVRRGRPYQKKLSPDMPLITGQPRHRHAVPDCKGRRGGRARPVRQRQDRRAAPACEVGRGRHRRLHRLRRARQRDDRCAQRVPGACRPENPAIP